MPYLFFYSWILNAKDFVPRTMTHESSLLVVEFASSELVLSESQG
jgi:hypothetical protein